MDNLDRQELVPIYTAQDSVQAEILKNALEAEGIPAAVEGEHQGGFSGVLLLRLFVREPDAERARAFLASHEHYHPEEGEQA